MRRSPPTCYAGKDSVDEIMAGYGKEDLPGAAAKDNSDDFVPITGCRAQCA